MHTSFDGLGDKPDGFCSKIESGVDPKMEAKRHDSSGETLHPESKNALEGVASLYEL